MKLLLPIFFVITIILKQSAAYYIYPRYQQPDFHNYGYVGGQGELNNVGVVNNYDTLMNDGELNNLEYLNNYKEIHNTGLVNFNNRVNNHGRIANTGTITHGIREGGQHGDYQR